MSSAKVALVTGAAGFIGGKVRLALIADGYEVVGAGRSTPFAELSLAQLSSLAAPPSLIVHCAGGSSVGQSVEAPLADFAKTVPPLAEVLEYLRTRAAGGRLVLLSSAAVYGSAPIQPIPEEAPLAPVSPYGWHKRICEELCLSYARNFGVSSAIVRLFSVYGPGLRKQLLWDACKKALSGERRFQGTGEELRDWLHIDDATALILTAAGVASPQVPIVNGGTGAATSVASVVGQLFSALAAGAPEFVGGIGRAGDPQKYLADISRARSFGWAPHVDVSSGISEYARWFRQQA